MKLTLELTAGEAALVRKALKSFCTDNYNHIVLQRKVADAILDSDATDDEMSAMREMMRSK